jgi:hypothetical protein
MSPYVALGIGVGAVAIVAGAWLSGEHHGQALVQAKWDAAKVVQQQAVIQQDTKVQAATATQASESVAVGVQVVHDTQVIYEKGKDVLVKVPVYVDAADDAKCSINAGFVRLWNTANGADSGSVPTGPSGGQQSAGEAGTDQNNGAPNPASSSQ